MAHSCFAIAAPQTCVFGLQNFFPLFLERMLILIFPVVVYDYHKNNVSDLKIAWFYLPNVYTGLSLLSMFKAFSSAVPSRSLRTLDLRVGHLIPNGHLVRRGFTGV